MARIVFRDEAVHEAPTGLSVPIVPFAGDGTITGVFPQPPMDGGGVTGSVLILWDGTDTVLQGSSTSTTPPTTTAPTSARIATVAFVRQALANFGTAPGANAPTNPAPVNGTLWWDSTNKVLNVRDGTSWLPTGGGATIHVGAVAPSPADEGALWFNTNILQLLIRYQSVWVAATTPAATGAWEPSIPTGGYAHYGTVAPPDPQEGDLWATPDGTLKIWTGSVWQQIHG